MNRRSFLQWMAAWGSFLSSMLVLPSASRAQAGNTFSEHQSTADGARHTDMKGTSRVVMIRNTAVLGENNLVDSRIADQMVTAGMSRLTGESGADAA